VPTSFPGVATTAVSKKYIPVGFPLENAATDMMPAVKRRRLMQEVTEPVYPFFGDNLLVPKSISLRCLEFLPGKDIYNTSLVNHLWCTTAMDNALWEVDE
jgi:hypothetical protein